MLYNQQRLASCTPTNLKHTCLRVIQGSGSHPVEWLVRPYASASSWARARCVADIGAKECRFLEASIRKLVNSLSRPSTHVGRSKAACVKISEARLAGENYTNCVSTIC